MRTIKNIRELLSSNDINIIKLCEKFVDERASLERMRGDAAERRANIILSTLGASSAFLVFIASTLLSKQNNTEWLIIFLYAASAMWVSRSVWYCIKSIRTQSRYGLKEECVYEVQEKSELDAIKELLSGKIWELQHTIQPNTERLFYVQRAQRAFIVFIGILLFLGVVAVSRLSIPIQSNYCIVFILSIVGVVLW
jgi:hypothetical protein